MNKCIQILRTEIDEASEALKRCYQESNIEDAKRIKRLIKKNEIAITVLKILSI